jgi:hypothetical protein
VPQQQQQGQAQKQQHLAQQQQQQQQQAPSRQAAAVSSGGGGPVAEKRPSNGTASNMQAGLNSYTMQAQPAAAANSNSMPGAATGAGAAAPAVPVPLLPPGAAAAAAGLPVTQPIVSNAMVAAALAQGHLGPHGLGPAAFSMLHPFPLMQWGFVPMAGPHGFPSPHVPPGGGGAAVMAAAAAAAAGAGSGGGQGQRGKGLGDVLGWTWGCAWRLLDCQSCFLCVAEQGMAPSSVSLGGAVCWYAVCQNL